jgi:hypothetical protein
MVLSFSLCVFDYKNILDSFICIGYYIKSYKNEKLIGFFFFWLKIEMEM